MTRTLAGFTVLLAFSALGAAQQQNQSSKIRPGHNANGQGNVLGSRPDQVLRVTKARGVISSVDLEKRTVTITLKGREAMELGFSQPAGREQIKTSKKAARSLGKRKLALEEVTVGSRVQLEYYAVLSQMLELLVEEAKS